MGQKLFDKQDIGTDRAVKVRFYYLFHVFWSIINSVFLNLVVISCLQLILGHYDGP